MGCFLLSAITGRAPAPQPPTPQEQPLCQRGLFLCRCRGQGFSPLASPPEGFTLWTPEQGFNPCRKALLAPAGATPLPPRGSVKGSANTSVRELGCRGSIPQPQSSRCSLSVAPLASVDSCGSLSPSANSPQGWRFPPLPCSGVQRVKPSGRGSALVLIDKAVHSACRRRSRRLGRPACRRRPSCAGGRPCRRERCAC